MADVKISQLPSGSALTGSEIVPVDQTVGGVTTTIKTTAQAIANLNTSAAGPQGVQGPAGPPGPVGPAGLTWQGSWVSGTSYVLNDAVGYNGASYFCILATSGTTAPPSATSNWALLAAQGATGPAGAQGPTGATGPQGIQGPAGPQGPIGATGATGPQGPTGTGSGSSIVKVTKITLNSAQLGSLHLATNYVTLAQSSSTTKIYPIAYSIFYEKGTINYTGTLLIGMSYTTPTSGGASGSTVFDFAGYSTSTFIPSKNLSNLGVSGQITPLVDNRFYLGASSMNPVIGGDGTLTVVFTYVEY